MLSTDVIYVALLFLTIAIGLFYRKIEDLCVKQWTSTIIGLIIATAVSGGSVLHPLTDTLVNAIIITKLSPKICHLASFFFSFFYLLVVFRFGYLIGIPIASSYTNVILMILTLKLPGLAFEINSAANAPSDDPEGVNSDALKDVRFVDVFHYAFSYMGLLTGPYYRYRTYWDSLHRPFSKYVDPWPLTLYKLKQIAVFIVLFFAMNSLFPTSYIVTPEFAEWPFLCRNFYMYPSFAVFKLRMYIGMILSECACQMAGVGAYPTRCKTVYGLGPRDYKSMESLSATPEKLKDEQYDFETVRNMNVWDVETCISTRTAMRVWNICTQYWMATCVYKRFPHKGLRILATLTLSALWHGSAPGYFVCMCQIPVFLIVEDIFIKFYERSEENSFAKRGWGFLMWYLKTTCMAYLGVPFLLLDIQEIIHFYKQVYFSGHVVIITLYILGRCLKPYLLTKEVKIKEKEK